MHPETFRHLHAARSTDLRREAAAHNRARACGPDSARRTLRTQLGWTLVELGLRLVRTTGSGTAETRLRTAGAR
ncbi:hypothetical protein ACFYVL_22690 [Streptomyces sp. NPDC004111]|uniref:hypothetical protein n=1 Tax=Streptomyces sp. NPDC004111 TaxID=3364690 RepID=UPI00368F8F05